MTSHHPALRVAGLTKSYGAGPVLTDVSVEVAAGETLVLLGPSGCGKTTLLKCLNRLVEPDEGRIELHGQDVRRQPVATLRRGIGYVIQQVGLLPHLTVAQNVGVVPGLLGWPPARTAARVAELLERLHLPVAQFGPRRPAELSGGQQQRVGLARALAADPPLVLLDEPFGALDPLTRAAVRRDFRELDELRRKTVVLVTHDVAEAFELADRILLLRQGRVEQLGPPRELLRRPASAFVRDFLAADRLGLELRVTTLAELRPWLAPPAAVAPAGSHGQELASHVRETGSRRQENDSRREENDSHDQANGSHDQETGSHDQANGSHSQAGGFDSQQPADLVLPWHLSVQEALALLATAPGQRLPLADTGYYLTTGQVLAAFGQALPTLSPTSHDDDAA